MRIGVIGLGEVGRCYATALAARPDVRLSLCDPAPSAAANDLAIHLRSRIEPAAGAWLAECEWVFSCVTGSAAERVACECIPHLRAQAAAYADFTTAAPERIRSAARVAASANVAFLDVAIMGAIAATGARTPLLAAGQATPAWQDLMRAIGARVTVLPNSVAGDATTLKLLRSAFTKSLEAVVVEVLAAAERRGLRHAFYEIVSDIGGGLLPPYFETLIVTHVVHAARRRVEVEDVRRQFDAIGLVSDVLSGVEASFARTDAALAHAPMPAPARDMNEALRWLIATRSVATST